MTRHRGIVSRAASALLFCLAAGAALHASALPSAAFRPAQVPAPEIFQDPEYNPADLCADLGGQRESADGAPNSVCSNLDSNDTFCFVNSADALPCLGLFRHVITCNREHNRPALDPFHCAKTCGDEKARGGRCEKIAKADAVLAVRATVIFAAEGFTGAAHTITVGENWTLTFRPRDNPAGRDGFDLVEISDSDDWEIQITSAIKTQALVAAAVARIRRDDYYPDALSVSVNFAPVARPVQADFASVQTQTPLAGIVLAKPVAPHDNGRFEIAEVLLDGSPRDDYQFTLADDGAVGGQIPFPGTFLLRADYFADPANPFLGPMRISATIVATGAGQAPLRLRAVFENRAPTIFIAENFSRSGAKVFTAAPDNPRYTLAFAESDSAELDFDSQGGIFSFPAGATMTADRVVVVVATVVGCPDNIECVGAPEVALTLFARVAPAPAQPTLRASRAAGFSHRIRLPPAPAGMRLTLANPASPFFVFGNRLTPASADAPRAGKYRATILATHGEMVGTLALEVPAEIWFVDAARVRAHCAAAGGETDDAISGGETVGAACKNFSAQAANCFGPGPNYNSAVHLEVEDGGGESVSLCDDFLSECPPGQIDFDGGPFTNPAGGEADCHAPSELVTIFFRAVSSDGGPGRIGGNLSAATRDEAAVKNGMVLVRPGQQAARPIIFTATPRPGYYVSGWSGGVRTFGCRPGDSVCWVNPFFDVNVAVTFSPLRRATFRRSGPAPSRFGIFSGGGRAEARGPGAVPEELVLGGLRPGARVTMEMDNGQNDVLSAVSVPGGFCAGSGGASDRSDFTHDRGGPPSHRCVLTMPDANVLVSVMTGAPPLEEARVRFSKLPGGRPGNGGTIREGAGRASGFAALERAPVTLFAEPADGWRVSWNAAAGCDDGATVCVFPASASADEVVAVFDAGDDRLLEKFFPAADPAGDDGHCLGQRPLVGRPDPLVQGGATVGYWCNIRLRFGGPYEACVQLGANYDPAAADLAGVNAESGYLDAETFNAGDLFADGIPPLCSEKFPDCPSRIERTPITDRNGNVIGERDTVVERRRLGGNPFNECEDTPPGRTIRFGWEPAEGGKVVATVVGGNSRPPGLGGIASGAEVDYQAQAEFTAIPAEGWYVAEWNTAGGGGAPPECGGKIGGPTDTGPQVCLFVAERGANAIVTFARLLAQGPCEEDDIRFGPGGSKCVARTGDFENDEATCQLFGGVLDAGHPDNPRRIDKCQLGGHECTLEDLRTQNGVPLSEIIAFCAENAFNAIRLCLSTRTYGSCEVLRPKCNTMSDYDPPGDPFSGCNTVLDRNKWPTTPRPDFDLAYLESACAAGGGNFASREDLLQEGDGEMPPEGVAACFFTGEGVDVSTSPANRIHSCHIGDLAAGETSVRDNRPIRHTLSSLSEVLQSVSRAGDWAAYPKTSVDCGLCPAGQVTPDGRNCVAE